MYHILILWPNSLDKRDYIIHDLEVKFRIHSVFSIHWDNDRFTDNIQVFYSESWKHLTDADLQKAIQSKCRHCGTGNFIAVVFKDTHPAMGWRETTEGRMHVNTNVFDKKMEYRQITGGGHLIHCSNNDYETNRDLTLLLGLNTTDFLFNYSENKKEIKYCKNCSGVNGYNSISQLFYVLNNCINYCILRNHECLPDKYTIEGHGDIDLLVENKQQMVCLTLAKPVFPEPNRVYHTIKIEGKDVPFDFRYLGDDYYDVKWEYHILEHKVLSHNLFYVPTAEDQYFSLLYHAYIQKKEVKADYNCSLEKYAEDIGVKYTSDIRQAIHQLDDYMSEKGYEYMVPSDASVVFNQNHLKLSQHAKRNGQCIKRTEENGSNGYIYSSRVYIHGEHYIKQGTKWLIENEAHVLSLLDGYCFAPQVCSIQEVGKELSKMEITKMEGEDFSAFFSDASHQHSSIIHSFLQESIKILSILNKKGISHRDFMPSNILISSNCKGVNVSVVDFGWATTKDTADSRLPKHLGGRYAYEENHTDYYALGIILMDYWPDLPYIRYIASVLQTTTEANAEKNLCKLKKFLYLPFSPYDQMRLLYRRQHRLSAFYKSIFK